MWVRWVGDEIFIIESNVFDLVLELFPYRMNTISSYTYIYPKWIWSLSEKNAVYLDFISSITQLFYVNANLIYLVFSVYMYTYNKRKSMNNDFNVGIDWEPSLLCVLWNISLPNKLDVE